MLDKLLELLKKANLDGIPVPFIKDPKTNKGSVTLTMFVVSFNVSLLALAGKITQLAGSIDYGSVMTLYGLAGAFYLGRKLQTNGKNITLDDSFPTKSSEPSKEDAS